MIETSAYLPYVIAFFVVAAVAAVASVAGVIATFHDARRKEVVVVVSRPVGADLAHAA